MNFNLLVIFLDGSSQEVSGIAADLVAFEAQFDISVSALGQDVKITYLLWLAWHVEKRLGNTKDTFEKWVETVSTVEAAAPKK
jgi:hypothetical protein